MDLMSVCRTCMSSSSLNPIFPLPDVHERFSDAIYLITGIKVTINDGLSQKMCIECLKQVNDAMKFRAKCKETEETLMKIKSEVRRAVRHNERIVNYRSDFIREIKVGNRWVKIQPTNNVVLQNHGNNNENEQPLMHLLNTDTNDIQNIYITDETGEQMIPLEMLKVEMDSRQVNASNYDEDAINDQEDGNVQDTDYDVNNLQDDVSTTDVTNEESALNNTRNDQEDIDNEVNDQEDADEHPEYTIINIQGNVNNQEVTAEDEVTYEDPGETIDETEDTVDNQEDAVDSQEDSFNDPEYCKWEFEKEEALIEHVVACTAKKKRKTSDSNHERRHRGEKPYVCERCGAKFHAPYLLAQHKHSHRTERNFKCEMCGVCFKTNNGLHSHRRTCQGNARRLRSGRALDGVNDAPSEINDL